MKKIMRIDGDVCIDCGVCRETCPFSAVMCAFVVRHRYEILADRCEYCGGPGKAPCEVYCPVPKAIVPDTWAQA